MQVTTTTDSVLSAVKEERYRQHRIHGDNNCLSNNTDAQKLAVLSEEFGEVAKEVCEGELFGEDTDFNLYKELIQVAAVATAFAETLVRDGRIVITT